jgi:hypothetical protein
MIKVFSAGLDWINQRIGLKTGRTGADQKEAGVQLL